MKLSKSPVPTSAVSSPSAEAETAAALDDLRIQFNRHGAIILACGVLAATAALILTPQGFITINRGYSIGFLPLLTGFFGAVTGTILIAVGIRSRKHAYDLGHQAQSVHGRANPHFGEPARQLPPVGTLSR